ncbi:MAG: hypothetical protein AAF222_14545 [Pseudomonadota bacterium]
MTHPTEKDVLRARDFWGALVLLLASTFFIWRTSFIPFFGENRAGVSGSDWYNSAALVPFGIFGGLFILSLVLLAISIRDGGAQIALTKAGIGWNAQDVWRFATLATVLFFYIVGLVPRVDFVIGSGLVITALIYGYYGGHPQRMTLAAVSVGAAGIYALAAHLPRAEWKFHDDDIVALAIWALLSAWVWVQGRGSKVARAIPILAITAPLILVLAMAFGFRQNVPNRSGLLFKQIEYHYFVTLKPLWSQ